MSPLAIIGHMKYFYEDLEDYKSSSTPVLQCPSAFYA